jgi:hypothetical protein
MNVSFAFLCDYADQTSKMSAIGIGIDTIYAAKVPVVQPVFFAVIAIKFSVVETGSKRLGVRVITADGKDVVRPLDTTINVEPPPEGYSYRTQRIALGLHGVRFEQYGDYSVRWLIDGNEITEIPLKIAPPPAPPRSS